MHLCILWGRSAQLLPQTCKRQILLHCTAHARRCNCHWLQVLSGKFCLRASPSNKFLFSLSDLQRCLLRGLAVFPFCSKRPWPRSLNLEASWCRQSGKNHPARCLAWIGCPRMPEGARFTPMVLPHMFSRKNRKSKEQLGGGMIGIQVWDVRRGCFAKQIQPSQDDVSQDTVDNEQPFSLFTHSSLAEKS